MSVPGYRDSAGGMRGADGATPLNRYATSLLRGKHTLVSIGNKILVSETFYYESWLTGAQQS
eukprot:1848159-Rhodomonas_salina.2